MNAFNIADKKIGKAWPVLIVAEMSANHLQNFDTAVKIIKAAQRSGADAVKLQTYTPDTMTIPSDNENFRINQGTVWDGTTFYELYSKAYMPWEWQPKLKKIAEDLGLIFFSTPFDKSAVNFLEDMDVPAYKIASFEIGDILLLEYVASKGKPIIISTGIADLFDIEEAVNVCREAGNNQVALLKCVSSYPTPLEDVNLRTIPSLSEMFKVVVGLSDHVLGISVPIASVALGACIVEKHLTVDRALGGPDAAFSMEPAEFKKMTVAIREVEKALGDVSYKLSNSADKSRQFARSLFAVEDINAGEMFTEENIRSIRPGHGLHTRYIKDVLGKYARIDISRGTPLSWDMVLP